MDRSANSRPGSLAHVGGPRPLVVPGGSVCTHAHLGRTWSARIIASSSGLRAKATIPRHLPPHFVKGTKRLFHGASNPKQESVVIDFKKPEGRDLFLRLVPQADIVVENYRPGVMERLGLGYEKLATSTPGLFCAPSAVLVKTARTANDRHTT